MGRALLALALVLAASEAAAAPDLRLDGELRLSLDHYPDAPGSAAGATLWTRLTARTTWLGAAVRVEGRGLAGDTGWGHGGVLELGEARVAWAGDWGSLTLGRQQVAWGRADIFRLLDQVNPQRYPDALWGDPADARQPLWMVNLELPMGDTEWQLLAGVDEPLDAGNPAFPGPFPGAPSDPRLDHPEGFAGVRAGARLGGLAFSLHWLEHANLQPLWATDPVGVPVLIPRRARLAGLGADWPVGPLVLRLEAAATATSTLDARGGRIAQDVSQVLAGFDWQHGNWLVSPQVYRDRRDPVGGAVGAEYRDYASLLLRHRSFQDRLELRVFGVHGLQDSERWLSLRLGWTVDDHLELALHADRFETAGTGLLSPFADLSRVGVSAVLRF